MKHPFIEISNVSLPGAETSVWKPVSFVIHYGEIACFPDVSNQGTNLLSFLGGALVPDDGAIVIDGQLIEHSSTVPVLIKRGTGFAPTLCPDNYLRLFVDSNVEEFLSTLSMSHLVPFLEVPVKEIDNAILQEFETVIGIASGATCLLLHRPYEGLDKGQRKRLHTLLLRYVKKGCAVLYTASDPKLYEYSHKRVEPDSSSHFTHTVSENDTVPPVVNGSEGSQASQGVQGIRNVPVSGIHIDSNRTGNSLKSYLQGRVQATGRLGEALFDPSGEFGGLLPRLTVEEHFAFYLSDLSLIEYGHVHKKRLRGCTNDIFESYNLSGIEPWAYPFELNHSQRIILNLMIQLARLPQVLYCWFPLGGVSSSLSLSQREMICNFLRTYSATGGKCLVFSDNLSFLNVISDDLFFPSIGNDPHEFLSKAIGRVESPND